MQINGIFRHLAGLSAALFIHFSAFCSDIQSIDANSFRQKMADAARNSSEIWWVVREDSDSYVVLEESGLHKTYFSISKSQIKLHIPAEGGRYPVYLKSKDIEYVVAP